jgi:hypothetical protein
MINSLTGKRRGSPAPFFFLEKKVEKTLDFPACILYNYN